MSEKVALYCKYCINNVIRAFVAHFKLDLFSCFLLVIF